MASFIEGLKKMPRYYFYLTDEEGVVPDYIGTEFVGLWAAKHAALENLQNLLSDLVELEDEVGNGRVDIFDEDGALCASIQFDEWASKTVCSQPSEKSAQILRPFFGTKIRRTG